MSAPAHDWRLVAPWYRWPRFTGVPPRSTPPVLHKYETSKLVELFRENPQHSLKFTPEDQADGLRRLYLHQHKRFYLVACELHCDRLGFPNARRDEVCEAGFVLRRRRTPVPDELRAEATRLLRRIGKRKAQMAFAGQRLGSTPSHAVAAATAVKLAKAHARAQARLAELERELAEFAETNHLSPVLEGWVPSGELEHLGAWTRIEGDGPENGLEDVFPLYPLVPEPGAQPHAARGRSLYFGLVPTATADTQADGAPRLDTQTGYELHCFVRRHDPRCPRRAGRRDCHGELTWSEPSETFTLAPPADLVGTSNRPVTVHLPDLPALMEQARKLPFGAGAPLKMAAPAGSSLPIDVQAGKVAAGVPGIGQICSFAIPLITIVAFFVFRLFLPVVVLLFGLWPLLRLKFCIPPTLDLGLNLSTELGLLRQGQDLDARPGAAALRVDIQNAFTAKMAGFGTDAETGKELLKKVTSLNALVPFTMEQQRSPEDPVFGPRPPLPAGALPSPNAQLAPLIWEDELPIPELEEDAA